jgi:hypothetical protein
VITLPTQLPIIEILRTSSSTNSANFVINEFCELRCNGVLGSSPRKFQISLIWVMYLPPNDCYGSGVI